MNLALPSITHKFIRVEIRAEIKDNAGKVTYISPWSECHSLVKNFLKVLSASMLQTAITIKDTGNTDRATSGYSGNLSVVAAAGLTVNGIVIGTGTDAVTMDDYKLQTQATVNIAYALLALTLEAPDANSYRLNVSRMFTNNTGAVLNITEVGLYCIAGNAGIYFCIDRTLYSVAVAAGSSVTLTYRFTISL